MKTPKRLQPLIEDGLVDEVVRPLKSGKEAAVYVVRAGGEVCCAKVYKAAQERGFRQRAEYGEGRRVRNTRRARAMARGTRYGREAEEAEWQSAEVGALYRLADAGVRVPRPHLFVDGVLLMELVTDADGAAAPRLDTILPSADQALAWHRTLMHEVVRMLCAGLIHGDLSEYNVLVDAAGPVIIDLPQAVDAAGNNNACRLLVRDVDHLTDYFAQFTPDLADTDYAGEIWSLYEAGRLTPHTELTGRFEAEVHTPDVAAVLRAIEAARAEALLGDRAFDEDDEDEETG
ncbi:PA4780 family RIO1-like protein kinase [Sediminicurvatus halobius]|uniref:non-specific serine/threonine protein kinase n=1 Tax=Sediminicurvatus halobius TaxID=2182432 RepID=A0A2U2N8A0_9GAMM|nr:PA4780 family RIO1-like protein kinase [Spiribacter halobius]PWG65214.1 serine protein kinase RIO [Spiribacter halobius]UEX78831.1 serine protein kinase RIO [Spiribacter halobius]